MVVALNGYDISGRKLRVEFKKVLQAGEKERIERDKAIKRMRSLQFDRGQAGSASNGSGSTNQVNSSGASGRNVPSGNVAAGSHQNRHTSWAQHSHPSGGRGSNPSRNVSRAATHQHPQGNVDLDLRNVPSHQFQQFANGGLTSPPSQGFGQQGHLLTPPLTSQFHSAGSNEMVSDQLCPSFQRALDSLACRDGMG